MLRRHIIQYRSETEQGQVEVEATSKYNAKQVFYRKHPQYEIVSVEVSEE